jgi:hypothetical protein
MTRWFICTGLWLVLVQPAASVESAHLRVFEESERDLRERTKPPGSATVLHHNGAIRSMHRAHRRHKMTTRKYMTRKMRRVREHKHSHSSLVDHHGKIRTAEHHAAEHHAA